MSTSLRGCLTRCADLRYASDDARFAVPAARLGLGYPPPAMAMLRDLVGPARVKEILFTARRFAADEAVAMGLVNAAVPRAELLAHTRDVLLRIADNAPPTIASTKRVVNELGLPPEQRDPEAANTSVRACFESEDYREGIRAFPEKRRPRFAGR